jgi:predicted nucleic acid-binding Zn ribbon protein
MFCIVCGQEISEKQFRNTCDKCEKQVSKLSQKILKSRKKIDFRQLRREKQKYSRV